MHKYTLQQRQQQIEEKFAQNMKSFHVLALFKKTNYEEVNLSLEDLIKVFTVIVMLYRTRGCWMSCSRIAVFLLRTCSVLTPREILHHCLRYTHTYNATSRSHTGGWTLLLMQACADKNVHTVTQTFFLFFIILSYVFICGFPSPEKII